MRGPLKIARASDWYSSKAAGLAGLLFLFALQLKIDLVTFLKITPLAFTTLVGIAGLGYLINDFSDKEKDKIAGKRNFILESSLPKFAFVTLIFLCLAFIPWVWLPKTQLSFGFIIIELLLFILYSFNPIRLKERKTIGLITDSLYAHVVPSTFAFYTFWLVSNKEFPLLLFTVLAVWQFLVGFRSITQHHITDRKKDAISKTHNFYNTSPNRAISLVSKRLLLPEILTFLVFCLLIEPFGWVFIIAFIAFCINQMFTWRGAIVWRIKSKLRVGLASPSFFYEHRIGLIAGIVLSSFNTWFFAVTAGYIMVFGVDLKSIFWGIKIFFFKTLINPYYNYILKPWYKYVVHPFHSVALKYAYHYGHKVKVWLGIAKNQGN